MISFISFGLKAQIKVFKYYKIYSNPTRNFYKRKFVVEVNKIDFQYVIQDTSYLSKLSKIPSLTNDVEVLDYLESLGWHLSHITELSSNFHLMYFKKEFDASDVTRK